MQKVTTAGKRRNKAQTGVKKKPLLIPLRETMYDKKAFR